MQRNKNIILKEFYSKHKIIDRENLYYRILRVKDKISILHKKYNNYYIWEAKNYRGAMQDVCYDKHMPFIIALANVWVRLDNIAWIPKRSLDALILKKNSLSLEILNLRSEINYEVKK